MKNHTQLNSCETGSCKTDSCETGSYKTDSCETGSCKTGSCKTWGKHCSSCMKKMMFMITFILIIIAGYLVYIYFSATESKPNTVVNTNTKKINNSIITSYSEEKYNEFIGKKPLALFFHASWCPTCRAEEKLIKENISLLPKDLVILKADYDKETELKKKYNITMQSIIVVLDESGKEIGRIWDFSSIDKFTALFSKN